MGVHDQSMMTHALSPAGKTGAGTPKEQFLVRFTEDLELPRPPGVVLKLLEKASQPDCSVKQLTDIAHNDPVLCGKLLQAVNSAAFGLRHPVSSIHQALSILGIRQARSLALSLTLPDVYSGIAPSAAVKEFWMYSLCMGVIARDLSARLNRPAPADDLVAGLLCDLGSMVLQQADPAGVAEVYLNSTRMLSQNQCEIEDRRLGINHAELSAFLLTKWRLPPDITEPIRFHHQPKALEGAKPEIEERAWLLYFASQVTSIQTGIRMREIHHNLMVLAQERFGMNRAQLLAFLEPLKKNVDEFAALIKVEIADCGDFAKLFAGATQQLARMAIEASAQVVKAQEGSGLESGLWRLLREAGNLPHRSVTEVRRPPAVGASSPKSADEPSDHGDAFAQEITSEQVRDVKLGNYTIIEVLGRGGMGIVFRAFDNALRRHVAIKVLGPGAETSAVRQARFAREAEIAASITHENVVTIYAVGGAGAISYLVMEYVDGMSLQDRLETEPKLGVREILELGLQIVEGLAAAHARNLIHRDIKPANILLMKNVLRAKITDFGLARPVADSSLTQHGALVGTPQYMAPEQVCGEALDFRSDLFSYGGVLYAMCTGQMPFGGDSIQSILRRIRDDPPRPIVEVNRAIPKDLVAIIDKLLAKYPKDRFQTANEVARLLRVQMLRYI